MKDKLLIVFTLVSTKEGERRNALLWKTSLSIHLLGSFQTRSVAKGCVTGTVSEPALKSGWGLAVVNLIHLARAFGFWGLHCCSYSLPKRQHRGLVSVWMGVGVWGPWTVSCNLLPPSSHVLCRGRGGCQVGISFLPEVAGKFLPGKVLCGLASQCLANLLKSWIIRSISGLEKFSISYSLCLCCSCLCFKC